MTKQTYYVLTITSGVHKLLAVCETIEDAHAKAEAHATAHGDPVSIALKTHTLRQVSKLEWGE